MPGRPLSPHLSVYKFKYTLTTSILNRLTGMALSGGFLLLVYWLAAVGAGAEAQERAQRHLAAAPLWILYGLLLFAFCYHLIAGIRHLVWDTGHGLERRQAQRSAWLVGVLSVLLTVLFAWLLWSGAARR